MNEEQKQSGKTNAQPNAHVWIVLNKSGVIGEMVICSLLSAYHSYIDEKKR